MTAPELSVIMPAYNEEATIAQTVESWAGDFARLAIACELRVYDDGSTDATGAQLEALRGSLPNLIVVHQRNRGHGPTVLRGYREARSRWIFQTDSDGEINPGGFVDLWRRRHDFDFLMGFRQGRRAPPARRLVTAGARWAIRLAFGANVRDANIPFRLMRRDRLVPLLAAVPASTFAPNVALVGLAAATGARLFEAPVSSRERAGGRSSLLRLKLLRAACRSALETAGIAWRFRVRGGRCRRQGTGRP